VAFIKRIFANFRIETSQKRGARDKALQAHTLV
jgi:hypothetical protein